MPENLLLCLLWLEEAWIGWDLNQFCAATRAATSVRINPGGRPCFEWISNQPSAIDDAHFHARLDIADRLGGFTRRGIDSAGAGNFVGACDS